MSWGFKGLPLWKKGLFIVAVSMTTLIGIVGIASWSLEKSSRGMQTIASSYVPEIMSIADLSRLSQRAHIEVLRVTAWGSAGIGGDALAQQFDRAETAIAGLEAAVERQTDGVFLSEGSELASAALAYIGSARDTIAISRVDPVTGGMIANETDAFFAGLSDLTKTTANERKDRVKSKIGNLVASADQDTQVFLGLAALGLLLTLFLTTMVVRSVNRPVTAMTNAMKRLSENDMDVEVPGVGLKNEIGEMAKAVTVFRDAMRSAEELRRSEEAAREDRARSEREAMELAATEAARQAEQDRREREATEARAAQIDQMIGDISSVIDAARLGDFSARITQSLDEAGLQAVVDGVNTLVSTFEEGLSNTGQVLHELSQGHLSVRMEGQYDGAFAKLQNDTNGLADRLERAIAEIKALVASITEETGGIAEGASELARRTEATAASLEESSAAMEELSASTRSTAEGAGKTRHVVAAAVDRAKATDQVVNEAILSINTIANVSEKVAQTISVINDIAFQTNLLALNAGVEAARAGESGRGFAVVASEVRALAQRASDSAREIEELIQKSTQEVNHGVGLVDQAGTALKEMASSINEISDYVDRAAEAANEQAIGISELTTALNQMDTTTQRNAYLQGETSTAAQSIAQSLRDLLGHVSYFRTQKDANMPSVDTAGSGGDVKIALAS